jgi:hypothetical protein
VVQTGRESCRASSRPRTPSGTRDDEVITIVVSSAETMAAKSGALGVQLLVVTAFLFSN